VVRLSDYHILEETFGSAVGRQLRRTVAQRLRAVLREQDVVVGVGDEVLLVIDGVREAAEAAVVIERVLDICRGVYLLEGRRLHVTPGAGIALFPADSAEPQELLRWARLALHANELRGTGPYQFFSVDLLRQLRARHWMAAELEDALSQHRFVLHYQPLFAVDTQRILATEALLRLRSSEGELIGPDRFIPLAESTGLMLRIGAWVIRESCLQLARWRRQGLSPARMAVNVSPKQLADAGFVGILDAAVKRAGIEHRDLMVEITEGQVVANLPLVEGAFAALSARGVQIAVDDFGTGYSALSYLTRLPLHAIKIDRSFLAGIPRDPRAERMVGAIVAMARQLSLEVTAEGVETEEQYRFLARLGCQLGQGFGFARPQALNRFADCVQASPRWKLPSST
jgi:EAL domain-containing protein (putative c-di-GMP-specific phosphodiesterase class I)